MYIEVEREVLTIQGGSIGKIEYVFYSSMNIYEYKNKEDMLKYFNNKEIK